MVLETIMAVEMVVKALGMTGFLKIKFTSLYVKLCNFIFLEQRMCHALHFLFQGFNGAIFCS